jgi:hypothetical protein
MLTLVTNLHNNITLQTFILGGIILHTMLKYRKIHIDNFKIVSNTYNVNNGYTVKDQCSSAFRK